MTAPVRAAIYLRTGKILLAQLKGLGLMKREIFKKALLRCAAALFLHTACVSSAISQTIGLNSEELAAARRTVDPEGKLPEGLRNIAALGSTFQYFANRGEPEKAQIVAAQFLQHYQLLLQRYANLVAQAKETQGTLGSATTAALKSYANLPEGRDARLTYSGDKERVIFHYVDGEGVTRTKALATPQQLGSSSMGMVRNGFEKALASAAGLDRGSNRLAPSSSPAIARSPPVARTVLPPPIHLPEPNLDISPIEAAPRKSPSYSCITMNEVYGNGSTTHCNPD